MSKNLRIAAVWLLGAALSAMPVIAAAAEGRKGGGGRGGGQAAGGGRGGGQVGGGARAGGGGQVGGGARAGGSGQGGGGVRSAPRGEFQAAPRGEFRTPGGEVRTAPRGEIRTAPRGEFRTPGGEVRTAPRGEVRTAPGAKAGVAPRATPGTVRRPESWNRDWAQHRGSFDNRFDTARHRDRGSGNWRSGHSGWHYPWYGSHFGRHGHGIGWGSYWWPSYYWWPGSVWGRSWWPGYYGYGHYGRGYPYYGYGYSYGYPYYGDYGDYVYDEGSYGAAPYTAAAAPRESMAVAPEAQAEASEFYDRALRAFQEGDFRSAMRLAAHAAIDNPEDANVHLLLSLAMFAQGDYQGAAMEAHGLAAMGKIPDWDMVFGFYGKSEPYEKQLRALEKFVGENSSAPEGRFLLGFHYMLAGHRDAAQGEFLEALKIAPEDRLAAELLTHVGGKVPAEIARRQSEAPTQPPVQSKGKPPTPAQPKSSPAPAVPPPPMRK